MCPRSATILIRPMKAPPAEPPMLSLWRRMGRRAFAGFAGRSGYAPAANVLRR